MLILKLVDPGSEGFRGVAGKYGAPGLQNDIPLIILLIHKMYADARLFVASQDYCFMHFHTVHPLPPVFGQKGRVDVHDPARVCLEQIRRDQPEETGKGDERDPGIFQQFRNYHAVRQLAPVEYKGGDPVVFCPFKHIGVRIVGEDKTDRYGRMVAEMADDPFGVGAGAGGEDSDAIHVRRGFKGKNRKVSRVRNRPETILQYANNQ